MLPKHNVRPIVLATKNRHKIDEIRSALKGIDIELLSLDSFPDFELKEEGKTLRENALQKAREVAKQTKHWALADDTGLFVEALGGRPGIYSARYAGLTATFQQNIAKLLDEMKSVPAEERGAYFSCLIALVSPTGKEITVEGRLSGVISEQPRGQEGFGYDPIFFLPDRGCTLAQISMTDKNKISHRGLALLKLKAVLKSAMELE